MLSQSCTEESVREKIKTKKQQEALGATQKWKRKIQASKYINKYIYTYIKYNTFWLICTPLVFWGMSAEDIPKSVVVLMFQYS